MYNYKDLVLFFSQLVLIHVTLTQAEKLSVKKILEHNTTVQPYYLHTFSHNLKQHIDKSLPLSQPLASTTIHPTVSQRVPSTVYAHTSKATAQQSTVKSSSVVHKNKYHGVNMEAGFLKELDELDEYMVNISKFEFACGTPKQLTYCSHVNYSVPATLDAAPFFQDSMAEAAVDTLNILTKGATTTCENQLKEIFCAEKFPVCHEFKETMTWHNRSKCTELLSKCPQKARDVFDKIKLCDKLSRGDDVQLTECIPYLRPDKDDLCQPKKVSPWLYHAAVEINSLLKFQFSLNKNLTTDCQHALTNQLCFSGLQCHTDEDISSYVASMKSKCENTMKVCEKQVLSAGIKDLFLKCERYS
ncbi:uncharacterized protein LOC130656843 [Hydractinia symbiolongicarpus]|uniref:uncharacterized protein LOC130656843 n=1 Tax=Hydractinia symbiolongicarpus TaxID=13093 RepID=UPI00254D9995|nr:uncharacterized protein LOC130656843 [Hydractinia symbiolongicarpus]